MNTVCEGGATLTITEIVKDTFAGRAHGTKFTTRKIIETAQKKYSVNATSVIPSDYCYNMDNKGKEDNPTLATFKIFEPESRGRYLYRGENYPYAGPVHRHPRHQ